jgi:hypothetical protein
MTEVFLAAVGCLELNKDVTGDTEGTMENRCLAKESQE